MTRLSAIAMALSIAALFLACSEEAPAPEPSPVPTATLTRFDAFDVCRDGAEAAAEKRYGAHSLAISRAFAEFRDRVEDIGDPYGVLWANMVYSDTFEQLYEESLGYSPWVNPEARALYDGEFDDCMEELGQSNDPLAYLSALSPAEIAILECVMTALVTVERDFEPGSVAYTAAYKNFAANRSGDFVDLIRFEKDYENLTGRSPFRDAEAMAAFRSQAASCPQ